MHSLGSHLALNSLSLGLSCPLLLFSVHRRLLKVGGQLLLFLLLVRDFSSKPRDIEQAQVISFASYILTDVAEMAQIRYIRKVHAQVLQILLASYRLVERVIQRGVHGVDLLNLLMKEFVILFKSLL